MSEIVSRCGYRCDACAAFAANNKTPSDREKGSAGWKKYFGLDFEPAKMECNGCLSDKAACGLPDLNCEVRKCVIEHEMVTCADCIDFPCEKMDERMENVEKIIAKFAGRISKEDFGLFMAPYDARKTLNAIRDRRVDRID